MFKGFMKDSFSEQYKHPKWQKRRLEMLESAGYECQHCYDKETELQVHHVEYIKGKNVWDYPDDYLLVLCKPCHGRLTDILVDTRRRATWEVYVEALESLNEVFRYDGKEMIASVLHRLRVNPDMIRPIFQMLDTLHHQRNEERNAAKISKAGDNQ